MPGSLPIAAASAESSRASAGFHWSGACAHSLCSSDAAAPASLACKLRHDILATSVHLSRPYRPGTRGCRETIRWTTTPCLCICCLLMPPFLQLLQPFYAPLG